MLALATYQLLLRLYPAAFRRRFEPELVQVFRDGCRAAYRERGYWGVWALGLATLPDIMVTAAQERFAQRKKLRGEFMNVRLWMRIGGIMAFVAIGCSLVSDGYRLLFAPMAQNMIITSVYFGGEIAILLMGAGLLAAQRGVWGRLLWGIAIVGDLAVLLLYNVAIYNPTLIQFGQPYRLAIGIVQSVALVAALVASVITWRARSLGRWSALPFCALLWVFVAGIINVYAITLIFSASHFAEFSRRLLLENMLTSIPGWLIWAGIGYGLLRVAATQDATAAQPADAVQ